MPCPKNKSFQNQTGTSLHTAAEMKSSEEKKQEGELWAAANELLSPPPSLEQLLCLLDKLEKCLIRVDQFPSKSMQNTLDHVGKALIAKGLLNHMDLDVKVSVASCINEIMRITAPDAPYDDDQMKEIFHLIVAAFENICDTSSRSYSKRVSILQNVALVRSWSLMLDLECHTLILQMFKHFLRNIRENHPDDVFSSMGLIMILLLEELESGEITPELLSPLLDSVRKGNKDALPIAQKLGERVIENCSSKLRPYMMQAVRYMGFPLDNYSEIVASLCQNHTDMVKHNGIHASKDNASGNHLADDSKKLEKAVSHELVELPKTCNSALMSKSKKDLTGELRSKKKAFSATCSTKFPSTKNTSVVEIPKRKSKRLQTLKKEEVSVMQHDDEHVGDKLIGSVIRVWWPEDQAFYEGVVDTYDSFKEAHKVLYANGCEELLLLGKERWEFVIDASVPDSGKKVDNLPGPEAPLQLGRGTLTKKIKGRTANSGGNHIKNAMDGANSGHKILENIEELDFDSNMDLNSGKLKTRINGKGSVGGAARNFKVESSKISSKCKDATLKMATRMMKATRRGKKPTAMELPRENLRMHRKGNR